MIPITLVQWQDMNHECRILYLSYIEAKAFDISVAVILFNQYRSIFNEEFVHKEIVVDFQNFNFTQYIKAVAEARLKACQNMQRLSFLEKEPVEYFTDHGFLEFSSNASQIIQQFQYDKKVAYAILHR